MKKCSVCGQKMSDAHSMYSDGEYFCLGCMKSYLDDCSRSAYNDLMY